MSFITDTFLLENRYAEQLYFDHARDQPILDYHNHLPPADLAADRNFANLTQIWLAGDHYKWRALRAHGVDERFVTGEATDREKFQKWAETVPYTLRNPLYHWTHLELLRYFGIDERLNGKNAETVWREANRQLARPSHSARGLLRGMNVRTLCTTDDPVDGLEHHAQLAQDAAVPRVLPAFRPDRALLVDQPGWRTYVERLQDAAETDIRDYDSLLVALERRMDFFHRHGCRISDHGLEFVPTRELDERLAHRTVTKALRGTPITRGEAGNFQLWLLIDLGRRYHARDWTLQLHLGALRNTNPGQLRRLGPDTGYDSIGDFSQARGLAQLLAALDTTEQLPRTVLYNLNPRDNAVFAAMAGNFQDGRTPGKIQYGSGWWFLDQLDGMERQLNALSNMGLLAHFVGMLTDSRSFLSFPRHEYFRRLLCQLFGRDIERGLLPPDLDWIGQVVENICYGNAERYFKLG